MKNYVVFRIACTLRVLFFFWAALCVDPGTVMGDKRLLDKGQSQDDSYKIPRYFALPTVVLILNDRTTISIAHDYVEAGQVPEKWNLPVVRSVAALLGGVACAASMLYMGLCASEKTWMCLSWRTDRYSMSSPCCDQNTRVVVLQFSQRARPRLTWSSLVSWQRGWAPKKYWCRRVHTSGALIRRPTAVGAKATGWRQPGWNVRVHRDTVVYGDAWGNSAAVGAQVALDSLSGVAGNGGWNVREEGIPFDIKIWRCSSQWTWMSSHELRNLRQSFLEMSDRSIACCPSSELHDHVSLHGMFLKCCRHGCQGRLRKCFVSDTCGCTFKWSTFEQYIKCCRALVAWLPKAAACDLLKSFWTQSGRRVPAVLPVIADTRLARAAVSDCCESFAGVHWAWRPLRLPQRESPIVSQAAISCTTSSCRSIDPVGDEMFCPISAGFFLSMVKTPIDVATATVFLCDRRHHSNFAVALLTFEKTRLASQCSSVSYCGWLHKASFLFWRGDCRFDAYFMQLRAFASALLFGCDHSVSGLLSNKPSMNKWNNLDKVSLPTSGCFSSWTGNMTCSWLLVHVQISQSNIH